MSHRSRVLLLDDHPDSLQLYSLVLREMGHEVTTATSVAEVRELCDGNTFDLLIADLQLRDGTGWEVIRQLPECFAGQAVALSGHGKPSDIAQSIEAGFLRHLTKPLDMVKFETAITEILNNRR